MFSTEEPKYYACMEKIKIVIDNRKKLKTFFEKSKIKRLEIDKLKNKSKNFDFRQTLHIIEIA